MARDSSSTDLRCEARDLEERVRLTAEAQDRRGINTHALALYKLANVRLKLGETAEAALHAQRAADLWRNDGAPLQSEYSAAARILQAAALAYGGKPAEALAVFESIVDECDGIPDITLERVLASGLELWMRLLHDSGDFGRQYEVTGLVLLRLDPNAADDLDRQVYLEAHVGRAIAAYNLGYAQEALELLDHALTLFQAENPLIVGRLEAIALLHLVDVLVELDRDEEASAVCRRLIGKFAQLQDEWAQAAVASAQNWIDDDAE